MIKPQLTLITIMFLCVMSTISSTSKNHVHGVGKKNTQNAEVMLEFNSSQSQHEQDFQDQQNASKKVQNKTSKNYGVYWNKNCKKWGAHVMHNKKRYFGGYFDNEEHAAMKVNLVCDKYGKKRKHPMINIDLDGIQKVTNKTSKYTGVTWNNNYKKWQVQLVHNKQQYYGGYFDNEEHAAMKVNLLCDKYGKERKNPIINIDLDGIQKVQNKTSKYTGVTWNKSNKCWQVQLKHNKKQYYGGYFDTEEHAAMKVNLLCDKIEIGRKNPMINIGLDEMQRPKTQTSKYNGVYWNKDRKKWQAQLMHKKLHVSYGGNFDNEDHAAMKVNLLCDKNEMERKNPMINIESDAIQKISNHTSKYTGVTWNGHCKRWQAQLVHKAKNYYGGVFVIEEHAAMKVNLLCDKIKIERKNPMIIIEPDVIQKISNQTSKYTGVTWHKNAKWQSQLRHKAKNYYGGLFDIEEHAAMKINLICDRIEIKRKNPEINNDTTFQKKTKSKLQQYRTKNIVNREVKVEDRNILDGFKDECQNRFIQSNDQQKDIATVFQNSNAKRKRKESLMMADKVKEENKLLEKTQ